MKVPVYVRDVNEPSGAFVGHAEHTELESVVELFNRNPASGRAAFLADNSWWPLYLSGIDSDGYEIVGTQFTEDHSGKNVVFEIVVQQEGSD